jgi:uncharacterized protein YPO0396
MKILKKYAFIKIAVCLIICGGYPAFAQTKSEPIISSSTDDKVTQLNVALTRMLDRQEAVRNDLIKLQENVTKTDERLTSQGNSQLETFNTKIEAIKSQIATEMASVQDALASIDDIKGAFEQEKLAAQQKSLQLNQELQALQSDVALLLDKQSQIDWADRFKVLKDEDGFADQLSRAEVERLAVEIPSAESCSELGDWLVENVPMRDYNRFYVMDEEQRSVCKIVNGTWAVVSAGGGETAHVVHE